MGIEPVPAHDWETLTDHLDSGTLRLLLTKTFSLDTEREIENSRMCKSYALSAVFLSMSITCSGTEFKFHA